LRWPVRWRKSVKELKKSSWARLLRNKLRRKKRRRRSRMLRKLLMRQRRFPRRSMKLRSRERSTRLSPRRMPSDLPSEGKPTRSWLRRNLNKKLPKLPINTTCNK